MPFTDDDLKRLKESFVPVGDGLHIEVDLTVDEMQALIARLRAAETVIQKHQFENAPCPSPDTCQWHIAWRKECGK